MSTNEKEWRQIRRFVKKNLTKLSSKERESLYIAFSTLQTLKVAFYKDITDDHDFKYQKEVPCFVKFAYMHSPMFLQYIKVKDQKVTTNLLNQSEDIVALIAYGCEKYIKAENKEEKEEYGMLLKECYKLLNVLCMDIDPQDYSVRKEIK